MNTVPLGLTALSSQACARASAARRRRRDRARAGERASAARATARMPSQTQVGHAEPLDDARRRRRRRRSARRARRRPRRAAVQMPRIRPKVSEVAAREAVVAADALIAATAPGPGEMLIAQEAAKKASQSVQSSWRSIVACAAHGRASPRRGYNRSMAKDKSIYICSECGGTSAKWLGKCPHCGAWNTLVETVAETRRQAAHAPLPAAAAREPVATLAEIDATDVDRAAHRHRGARPRARRRHRRRRRGR